MNFWLTVLTGISDPRLCLAFDVHSLNAVICVPLRYESKNWILLDMMKKTPVDLQKRFPVSQMPGGLSLRLSILPGRLSIPPGSGWGGKNAGWLGTWDSPLRTDSASLKSLELFIQWTSFCSSWILAVSSRTVSRSSQKISPWNCIQNVVPEFRLFAPWKCCGLQSNFFLKVPRPLPRDFSAILPCHAHPWYEFQGEPDFVLIVLLEAVIDLAWIGHTP